MPVQRVIQSHHESLVDLLCELHAHHNTGDVVARDLVKAHLVDNLLAEDSPIDLIVATGDDGAVVGLAAITLTWSLVDPQPAKRRQCWLKELYVLSSRRSNGAGRALMVWVAQHALREGCGRIDWPVQVSNPRGIAFYEGLGAKRVDDRLSFRLAEPDLSRLAGRPQGD